MNKREKKNISAGVSIEDVLLFPIEIFTDKRGSFEVLWESGNYLTSGVNISPSSLNFSYNTRSLTLRGLHFQVSPHQQAKLVSCVQGKVFDVVVDLRRDSSTYKKWAAFELSPNSGKALFIPKGCAHGFLTLHENTILSYLIEGTYEPNMSRTIRWNDPEIGIDWPVSSPILSRKDRLAPGFAAL